MTSKTSQKTEDMLDQTFQNFDSEQTVTATQGGGGSTPGNKSSNVKLMIGLGAACILISGYVLFVRPAMDTQNSQQSGMIPPAQQVSVNVPQTQEQPPVQNTVAPQQPQQNEMQNPPQVQPVVQQPIDVQPQQPVVNAQLPQVNQNIQQQMPIEAQQMVQPQNVNPTVAETSVQQPNQIQPLQNENQQVVNQQQTAPQNVAMNDLANKPNQVNQPITVDVVQNGQQQVEVKVEQPKVVANYVVDDIVSRLDKQNAEFKAVFTDIDGKLVSIQNTLTEQKDINQKVDTRLTALEGKTTQGSKEAPVKPVVQKQSKPKVQKTEVVIKEKDVTEKITIKSKSPAKVSIHSIYGGRVWVKNPDGSLSTYSAGDKLPNGETIKVVDDENLEIVTDSRVIKN